MEIKFNCKSPACQQRISVEPSMAGRGFRCPKCDMLQTVPGERVVSLLNPADQKAAGSFVPWKNEPNSYTFGKRAARLLCGWGIGLALCGLLLEVFHLHVRASLPRNFAAIEEEISSVGEFRKFPLVNQSGSELMYARNLKTNVGGFLVDLVSLQKGLPRLRGVSKSPSSDSFNLLGWSPDDKYKVFSWTLIAGEQNRQVGLCDENTGALRISFTAPGSVRKAVWLTTNSMAFIDNFYGLYLYNLKRNSDLGKFGEQGLVKLRTVSTVPDYFDDSVYSLTRVSDTGIGYVDQGNVFTWDLAHDQAHQLTHFDNQILEWLDYSPERNQFIFCLTDQGGGRFRRCYLFNPKVNSLVQCSAHDNIFKGLWVLKGWGIAYVNNIGNQNCITIDTKDRELRTNLFMGGHIRSYSVAPNGKSIYAIASTNEEPLGIWEYDILRHQLRNIVLGIEKPFVASHLTPVINTSVNGMGYFYLLPTNMEKGKKYPLLIDASRDSRWDAGAEILANAGIIYAAVNRFGLSTTYNLHTSSEDMLGLYKEMVKNPNVDQQRVYLAGTSAGTWAVNELVDADPTLWRGAAYLSPSATPHISPSTKHFPSIFISLPTDDRGAGRVFADSSLRDACINQIPIRVVCHLHSPHILETTDSIRERWAGLAKFILLEQ